MDQAIQMEGVIAKRVIVLGFDKAGVSCISGAFPKDIGIVEAASVDEAVRLMGEGIYVVACHLPNDNHGEPSSDFARLAEAVRPVRGTVYPYNPDIYPTHKDYVASLVSLVRY